jgi:formylglycine-generating enzyme required for sulfatase activity
MLVEIICRDKKKGYIKKGLAAMQGSLGSLVAYATAPNTSALGSERKRNSVYTQYLVRALKTRSNLSVSDMLTYVTNKVSGETGNRQIPWQSGSMKDIFCFSRCGVSDQQAEKIANIKRQQAEKIARRDAKIARLEAQLRASKQQQTIIPTQTRRKPTPVFSNSLVAGKVFRDRLRSGGLGPKMVVIPAGSFRMSDIQGGGSSDEQPVHRVSVEKFAMGVYEVTVGEYMKFVKATNNHAPEWLEKGSSYNINTGSDNYYKKYGSALTNKNHPIVGISWHDAVAYAKWLTNQTGNKYRLPTEAEWEYAARAGTETKYWWGNNIGKNKANCSGNYCGDSFEYTSPVGSFPANQFNLYDTTGILWGWTCSKYTNKYNGNEKQCVTNASRFVVRGGSWYSVPRNLRSANRFRNEPTYRDGVYGFRLARLLTL